MILLENKRKYKIIRNQLVMSKWETFLSDWKYSRERVSSSKTELRPREYSWRLFSGEFSSRNFHEYETIAPARSVWVMR
jgi:hypothetical protein